MKVHRWHQTNTTLTKQSIDMSERKLSIESVKLFKRREDLAELEKRKQNREEPVKPSGTVNYGEADDYQSYKEEYDEYIKIMDQQISEQLREISVIEQRIKGLIPSENVSVKVSGKYDNTDYQLVVRYIKNDEDDRIEIEQR